MAPFIIITIILLGLVLLVINKLRYDVIALVLLSLALLTRVVKYENAYAGFMNPAVISVGCIMIITRSFIHSNVLYLFIEKTSKWMKNQVAHVAILVSLTTFFSMFMNNVGALSLVLPIAVKTADDLGHSRSSILMPIAFGAGLGGLCTSFGTPPNLIISNFRKQAEMTPFTVFDFAPVGLSVTLVGFLFLVFFGWRIIKHNRGESDNNRVSHKYSCEILLKEESPLAGKTLKEVKEDKGFFYPILAAFRVDENIEDETPLKEHDRLILDMKLKDLEILVHRYKVQFKLLGPSKENEYHFVEAVVTKSSRMIGQLLKDINLSGRFDFNIVGVRKSEGNGERGLDLSPLQAGDAVLIATKQKLISKHTNYLGLLTVNWLDPIKEIRFKNFLPFIFFAVTVLLNILRILPLQIALSFAVLLILLTRCLPLRHLYESVNWPVIILLGAMIPIANSFQTSGGAEMISHLFLVVFCKCHPILLLALVMLVTIFLSDLINNTATALIMAPIAIDVARGVGLNVDTFLMAVAVGASCSFATPIGHQNNVIIYNIGKYKFSDYVKLGLPLEAVVFAVALPALLYFWPIYG